jgi:putative ABC transport system substrate-binding protein
MSSWRSFQQRRTGLVPTPLRLQGMLFLQRHECYPAGDMRRRQFLSLIAGAATLPLPARAQQSMPVVGYLTARGYEDASRGAQAIRRGLAESGFAEGRNVALEVRSANGRYDRLAALATELVDLPAAVIAASGITTTLAAKRAAPNTPIVFHTGGDPVRNGLVTSFNRPGGNLTGVATLGKELVPKQMELLDQFAPPSATIAFVVNPNNAATPEEASGARAASAALGRKLIVVEAGNERDLSAAFAAAAREDARALLIQTDPFFDSARGTLIELMTHYSLPTVSPFLDFPTAGGLIGYGSNLYDALQIIGNYAGRILKGEKPGELPVQQSMKVELIVNLKAARTIGLALPPAILLRAAEVIE